MTIVSFSFPDGIRYLSRGNEADGWSSIVKKVSAANNSTVGNKRDWEKILIHMRGGDDLAGTRVWRRGHDLFSPLQTWKP